MSYKLHVVCLTSAEVKLNGETTVIFGLFVALSGTGGCGSGTRSRGALPMSEDGRGGRGGNKKDIVNGP